MSPETESKYSPKERTFSRQEDDNVESASDNVDVLFAVINLERGNTGEIVRWEWRGDH